MAQSELFSNELMAEMLGIDYEAVARFEQMTPTEQLYIGGYAVAKAQNDSWRYLGPIGHKDIFSPELEIENDLPDAITQQAFALQDAIARVRLDFAENNFLELAKKIFTNNVMVLNGSDYTTCLDPKTGIKIDESMTKIDFVEREFVKIVQGKRTHQESTVTVKRVLRDSTTPKFGSKFYALYETATDQQGLKENHWPNPSATGWIAAVVIDTHPNMLKGRDDSTLVWRADRPLHIPRQRKPRS